MKRRRALPPAGASRAGGTFTFPVVLAEDFARLIYGTRLRTPRFAPRSPKLVH